MRSLLDQLMEELASDPALVGEHWDEFDTEEITWVPPTRPRATRPPTEPLTDEELAQLCAE